MKTKSKLVLGLSILSAATLAAGATSTFAWYSVQNGAKADTAIAAQNLTTVEPIAISEVVDIQVAIERVDSGDLHLATIVEENSTKSFVSKYELNGNYYPYSPAAGTQFNIYSVAVKQSDALKADKLAGSTVSITLGLNKKMNQGGTAIEDDGIGRTKGYITATAATAGSQYDFAANGTSISTSAELNSSSLQTIGGQILAYVFVYVEGANGTSGADSTDAHESNIQGNFAVTIAGNDRS